MIWPRGGHDVLVRLMAASLNPADIYFRSYGPYIKNVAPILGHDGAGVVEEIGGEVARFRPGDRVCFCNGGIGGDPGTYAEFAVVPEEQLVRVPGNVDWIAGAALPLVTITAWEALYERAALVQGEYALIHAGAGGTGHVAVQLAALKGAHIATTVSSEAKAEFVRGLGVDRPILYRQEDFVDATLAWTSGRGLAIALDNIGAETLQRTFRAMGKLFAVMEAYPDLKANQNVSRLMEELTGTENKISFARQFYNDSVMSLNNMVQSFPSNMIAGMFSFQPGTYFEVPEAETAVPKVDLR